MSFTILASAVVQTWKLGAVWFSTESNIREGFGCLGEILNKNGQDTKATLEGIHNLVIQSSIGALCSPRLSGDGALSQMALISGLSDGMRGLGFGLLRLGSSYQDLA